MDFQISKLGDNERESIAMNFNNVNCGHVQELKLFFEKLKDIKMLSEGRLFRKIMKNYLTFASNSYFEDF